MANDDTARDDTAELVAFLDAEEARIRHMILWNFLDLRDVSGTHRLGVATDEDLAHLRYQRFMPWPCRTIRLMAYAYRHREGWQERWRP